MRRYLIFQKFAIKDFSSKLMDYWQSLELFLKKDKNALVASNHSFLFFSFLGHFFPANIKECFCCFYLFIYSLSLLMALGERWNSLTSVWFIFLQLSIWNIFPLSFLPKVPVLGNWRAQQNSPKGIWVYLYCSWFERPMIGFNLTLFFQLFHMPL